MHRLPSHNDSKYGIDHRVQCFIITRQLGGISITSSCTSIDWSQMIALFLVFRQPSLTRRGARVMPATASACYAGGELPASSSNKDQNLVQMGRPFRRRRSWVHTLGKPCIFLAKHPLSYVTADSSPVQSVVDHLSWVSCRAWVPQEPRSSGVT